MARKPIENIDMLRPTQKAVFSRFFGKRINIYVILFNFILVVLFCVFVRKHDYFSYPFCIVMQSLVRVRVLVRKEKGPYFELALKQTSLDELTNGPKAPKLVLLQSGFIVGLPWDLGEWIWKVGQGLEELTFFGYSTKKGYRTNRAPR
jgi:hypothetical protein